MAYRGGESRRREEWITSLWSMLLDREWSTVRKIAIYYE
jgi:hypothetical protein